MKNILIVVAIGISFSWIILASLPSTGADVAGSAMLHKDYWVNPDGSRGLAVETVTIGDPGKDRRWVNPDGIHGTVGETQVGQSLVNNYFWINPDGVTGMLDEATDDREVLGAIANAPRD